MTLPWIIWTMPRTGGTTLSAALRLATPDHPEVEDEPFQYGDVPNRWAPVYAGWREGDRAPVKVRLHEMCRAGYCFKHIPEAFDDGFNESLARVSADLGYAHIVLDRRDVLSALVSRGVAEQLGAWQPRDSLNAIDRLLSSGRDLRPLDAPHLLSCLATWRRQRALVIEVLLRDRLSRGWKDKGYLDVASEDVYDRVSRHATAMGILKHVGAGDVNVHAMCDRLSHGWQDTRRVWHLVPNIGDVIEVLTAHVLQLREAAP